MEMETVAPGLRMLSVSRVVPEPAPASNAAAGNVKVKLSFLDAPWVATPPVQEVFLYERVVGGDEFAVVVKRLKGSLAAALALYLPLAGKLAYVEETQDIVIDCSQPGVVFSAAEAIAGCGMDGHRPGHGAPATEAVSRLVPEHDALALPAPVLAVQATRLNAGVALGVSVLHAVVDGRAFELFMETWSSISRGGCGSRPISIPVALPEYAREAIAHTHPSSDELARHVLNKVAPNLPMLANATTEGSSFTQLTQQLGRQTFVLGADDIRALKRRIDGLASPSAEAAKPVSTFVALSALGWTAFVQAKGLAAGEDTYLLFQVDLRARLRPPVAAGYVGNCVRGCVASADAGELVGEAGLLRASRAIQAAVKEVVAAPLAGMEAWIERVMGLPRARQAYVGGSPMFRVFQTADFGFDMPGKVLPVSVAGSPETPPGQLDDGHGGRIVLSSGKQEGDVHLSVTLDPVLMDAFKKHITSTPIRSKF